MCVFLEHGLSLCGLSLKYARARSSPLPWHAHDGAAHDDDGLSSEDEAESADEQKEQITISRA